MTCEATELHLLTFEGNDNVKHQKSHLLSFEGNVMWNNKITPINYRREQQVK